MAKNLMIVESPGKFPELKKHFGTTDWTFLASVGHFREIDNNYNNHYGFDFEGDSCFVPKYQTVKEKAKFLTDLKREADIAEKIYIAADPDREGDGIAWHVYEMLSNTNKAKSLRATFNELTAGELNKCVKEAKAINYREGSEMMNAVRAQMSRQVLDKLFGYKISKIIQDKMGGTSGGRVQSVGLVAIELREREIEAYVRKPWWQLEPVLEGNIKSINKFKDGDKWTIKKYDTLESAKTKVNTLTPNYKVVSVSEAKPVVKKPPLPFTTSACYKAASMFKMNTETAKKALQAFYDSGLTTYPRTDSFRFKDEFINSDINPYILKTYGKEYINYNPEFKTKKAKEGAQEGHDAIRPVRLTFSEAEIKAKLTQASGQSGISYEKLENLFKLIFARTVAACMQWAKYDETQMVFENAGEEFVAVAKICTFEGYKKAYQFKEGKEDEEETTTKILKVGDTVKCIAPDKIIVEKANPKPTRYKEPDLITYLENKGIGRPSTYETIIKALKQAGGVKKYCEVEKDYLVPTPMGRRVASYLMDNVKEFVNETFTKEMEENLDLISEGKLNWNKVYLTNFYKQLEPVIQKLSTGKSIKEGTATGQVCPKCGAPINEYISSTGKKYKQCSNRGSFDSKKKVWTGCQNPIEWVNEPVQLSEKEMEKNPKCPKCGGLTKYIKGKSKTTGKPYEMFKCIKEGCDGIVWAEKGKPKK